MDASPAHFFKCLGDETRLGCVLLLQEQGELCVCELTEVLELSQPKVSRHLAQLRECGLLLDRREGQWVFYRINPALPDWALSVIAATSSSEHRLIREWVRRLQRLSEPLAMAGCR